MMVSSYENLITGSEKLTGKHSRSYESRFHISIRKLNCFTAISC
jgi:hypothetical protein